MAGVPVIVTDCVTSLATVDVTRVRYAAGAYSTTAGSKGVFVAGTPTNTTIAAVIGPIDGRTRDLLPEGIRLRARYLCHTTADVRGDQPTASGTAITQADRIIFNGRTYQVYQDRDWVTLGVYNRSVLVEQTAEP
jgi:hypothetical protein